MSRKALLSSGLSLAVCGSLGITAPSVVNAQTTGSQVRLEEIVVTARKRDETLFDVPLSITALSSAQLERYNLQSMEEISKMTPGLFYTDFGGTGRQDRATSAYIIRGLALNNAGPGTDAATLFIDGVPVGNGNLPGSMDIERVEVLKGPQTAAFGRNTFSGAISVTTRDPGEKWGGGVTAERAKFHSSQIGLSVEGPIVEDKVFFRLSGEHRNEGAQYHNSIDRTPLGGQVTSSVWGVVKFVPTDALKIRIVANAFEFHDDHGAQVRLVAADHNCDPGKTGTKTWFCGTVPQVSEANTHLMLLDKRWQDLVFPKAHFPGLANAPGVTSRTFHTSGAIDYTFSNGWVLESKTGYNKYKYGNIAQEWYNPNSTNRFYTGPTDTKRNTWSWLYLLEGESNDFSQEVRLSSDSKDRLRWSLGGNYVYASSVGGLVGDVPLGAPLSLPGSRRQSRTPSGFASIYYDLLTNLELGFEGRYQKDKIADTPNFWTPTPSKTLEGNWTAFTPRVSAKYKPSDDITIFALWARGVRPGAFNAALAPGAQPAGTQAAIIAATGAGVAVQQEKINSYELGVKAKFLDGRGQATLTGYTGAITNQQIAQGYVVSVPSVNIGSVLVNQGRTKLSGIEADISFQVTNELLVSAAYSLNNTKITAGADTSVAALTGGNTNVLGHRLPKTPKDQGNVTFMYTGRLSDSLGWYVGGDFVYIGGKFPTTANLVTTGAQKLVNVRLGVEKDTLRVELWGKNVLDDRTPDQMFNAFDYDSFTSTALSIGLPKKATWGVRANYKF